MRNPSMKTMCYDALEKLKVCVLPFYASPRVEGGEAAEGRPVKFPLSLMSCAPEGLVTDYAVMHPILADHLKRTKASAPEQPVVRSWSRRDPVDAALDARLLLQRLKRDGPNVQLDRDRFEVVRTHKDWTSRYSPAVYLLAAERLTIVMDRWADAVLAEIMQSNAATN